MVQLGALGHEWRGLLDDEFLKPYLSELSVFLRAERAAGKEIFPAESEYFAALNATPPSSVRAVVLGQDPYHGPGQAPGLRRSMKAVGCTHTVLRKILRAVDNEP